VKGEFAICKLSQRTLIILQVAALICRIRYIRGYHITSIVQEDTMKHSHRQAPIGISNLPIPTQHVVKSDDADHLVDAVVDVVVANRKQATWVCNIPPTKC
jgi:hypothetical protein